MANTSSSGPTLPTITVDGCTFTVLFPDLVRPLTPAERADLRASIERCGIRSPVILDDKRGVIDGINRLRIAAEMDMPLDDIPFKVIPGLRPEQKEAIALELNVARRHLKPGEVKAIRTNAEKRAAVEAALKASPEKSDRAIASEVGVSHEFVRQVRPSLSTVDSQPTTRVGRDGRAIDTSNIGRRQPEPEPVAVAVEEYDEGDPPPDDPDDETGVMDDEPDDPEGSPQPGEIKSLGVGIERANEAINCLKRIPKNDGLRRRAFKIVMDWMRLNP